VSSEEEEMADKLVAKLKLTGRSIIDDFDSVIIIATFRTGESDCTITIDSTHGNQQAIDGSIKFVRLKRKLQDTKQLRESIEDDEK